MSMVNLTGDKSTLVQVIVYAIRQHTITRANVDPDLCCQMASLGHNKLLSTHLPKCMVLRVSHIDDVTTFIKTHALGCVELSSTEITIRKTTFLASDGMLQT